MHIYKKQYKHGKLYIHNMVLKCFCFLYNITCRPMADELLGTGLRRQRGHARIYTKPKSWRFFSFPMSLETNLLFEYVTKNFPGSFWLTLSTALCLLISHDCTSQPGGGTSSGGQLFFIPLLGHCFFLYFIFLYTWHQVDWRFGTCTRIYQEFKLCCDWHLTWLGGRDSHRCAIPDVACSWELSRLSDQEMASENGLPSKGPRD